MSAKDQIKQLVDYFKSEPRLEEKTDAMGDGLMLGANLADEANERSVGMQNDMVTLQQEYTENGNGSQTTAEITLSRDGEATLRDRLNRDHQEVTAQLAQTNENIEGRFINVIYNPLGLSILNDGVHDNTTALQTLIDSLEEGDVLFFPKGDYLTTDTLTFRKNIKIEMQGRILTDHANTGLLFKAPEGNFSNNDTHESALDIEIRIMRVLNGVQEFAETAVGVEMWNVYKGKIDFKEISRHYTGVKLVGDQYVSGVYAGFSYCNITIGVISSQKESIRAECHGAEGYFTQNQFYSGFLSFPTNDTLNSVHVVFDNQGTSVINENTFLGVSFEGGAKTGFMFTNANSNKMISCRFEMPRADNLFVFNNSRFNRFSLSDYVGRFMYQNKYQDNLDLSGNTNTVIEYEDYRVGYIKYYDRKYYIYPRQNTYTANAPVNNGVGDVPEHWDYEIIKNGYTDRYLNSLSRITDNLELEFNLKSADHFYTAIGGADPVDAFIFTEKPSHSKPFRITNKFSQKAYPLVVSSDYTGIVDLTGNNKTVPSGSNHITGYYNHYDNTVYIESIM